MTWRIKLLTSIVFLATVASAEAAPTATVTVFAKGTAPGVNATSPDSITTGDGSVWVEYGNGADSTGLSGSSTIVRYSPSGAVQATYTVPGLVDGLKFDPTTGTPTSGMVWALVNNDGNSTLSFINPTTNTVSTTPLKYAAPPYVYGPTSGRGYDDVAFLNGKVYLSFTNPVNPMDPVLQSLDQGHAPSTPLTTTSLLTAQQTNPLFTSSTQPPPDIDSLKSTPSGQLVLTSEGDAGAGPTSDGRFTLISNPGPSETFTNVRVTNSSGVNALAMDDVLFPGATAGTLYVADTAANTVYAVQLSGLDPNTPIVSLGSFGEVALVDPVTGVIGTTLVPNLTAPHGMDFVAAPEPATWPMLLLGLGGLAVAAGRRKSSAESHLVTAH